MKKLITLFLAMVMVMSLLAGCGSEPKEENAPAEVEKSEEKAEVSQEAPAEEELEFVTIKVISVGDPDTKAEEIFEEKVNEMLLEDLNCEIEVQNLTWAEWKDKYPLILASGEDWDIIYTASWAFYTDSVVKGAFRELTEEDFKTYMPGAWEYVSEKVNAVKVNGGIYMIPQAMVEPSDATLVAVRGDIMTEAGLNEITSVQDLEVYLDYVVAKHPDMNPLNINAYDNALWAEQLAVLYYEDETGFDNISEDQVIGICSGIRKIAGPFILDTSDPANLKYMEDEIVDEYFIKIFKKTQEWMEKGYWAADCLSINNAVETYYNAGTGAAAIRQLGNVAGMVKTLREADPDADARIYRVTDNYNMFQPPGYNNGLAINANSKNPERAMMVCDKLGYDQEYNDLLKQGIEGVHYNLMEDGMVEKIANPEYNWSVPTSMGVNSGIVRKDATNIPEYYELMDTVGGENCITPTYAGLLFQNAEVINEYAAVTEVNNRYLPILCAGTSGDAEATYYEYKEALAAAGWDAVLEEHLKQAQAFYDSLN